MVDWSDKPVPLEQGHLDLRRGAILRDGVRVALTTKETELLRYLVERASTDVPREDLLTDVWGYAATAQTRAVDTAVKRLRKKLELNVAEPCHLMSVHGVGYRFEPLDPSFTSSANPAPAVVAPVVDLSLQVVPSDGDRFVGRSGEWAAVDEAFASSRRFVTLRGAAGVGKSRLAREIARAASRPVVWISLRGIDQEALRSTLAAGLGAGRQDDRAIVEAIAARGDLLLVLDDADGVLPDLAKQTPPTLGACPRLHVLMTARAALELGEEQIVTVDPLRRGDAIALFLDRASSQLDPSDPEVGALVDDLDRLPLAIELAAPRTRVLSPAALRGRLQQRFKVLSRRRGSSGTGLEEAIAWSWEQLDPDERTVLADCSVFRAGFSAEAAEEVARTENEDEWVLDVLESLEAKSMVHRRALHGGGARLELLRSVQAFAAERAVELGREDAAVTRHRALYLGLGERLLDALHGPDVASAAAAMGDERRNLVVAWQNAEGEERARLAVVLGTQGVHASTVEEVNSILEQTSLVSLPPALQAQLRIARATVFRGRNRLSEAEAEAEEASSQASLAGDMDAWLDAERLRGGLEADGGNLSSACARLAAALARAPESPTPARLRTLAKEALLRFHHGEVEASGLLIDELLAGAIARRSPWHEFEAYRLRAGLRLRRSRLDDALHDGERSLEGFSSIGDRWRQALCNELLGAIASFSGHHVLAQTHHSTAVRLYRQMGRRHELPRALGNLARAFVHQQRIPEARKAADQALAVAREHGAWRAIEESAMLGGTIALAEDRWLDAEEHFSQGVEQAEAVGESGVAATARAARSFARMLQGHPDRAASDNAAARAEFTSSGDRLSNAFHSGLAAVIEMDRDCLEKAREYLAAAQDVRPARGHRELDLWLSLCTAYVEDRSETRGAVLRERLESESASAYVRALAGHLFRAVET